MTQVLGQIMALWLRPIVNCIKDIVCSSSAYMPVAKFLQLELEDGTVVNCAIITILTVEAKDYIVLLPLDEDGENEDGEVWFYGYAENPDDPNEEPVLEYIEDDDVYEKVADAFDEYLDSCEFDGSSTITIQRNKESGWEPGTLCCACKAEKFQVFFALS